MFSLVVPIYNEEYLVDELVLRSVTAIEGFTADYEIIFVDDGSTDSSLQNLLLARQKNSRIKVLSLSKNFGHQAAFTAGLEHAVGDTIAMMDGDLQDPPELLPGMYNKIHKEDIDIVSGKRIGRTGSRSIRFYTFIFHLLFKNLAGIQNIENSGNFSMMNRIALSALLTMHEKVRYMPGLRSFIGFKHDFVEYFREDRKMGKTKMNLSRLFILGTDAIFSFSKSPIRLCLLLGIVGTVFFMAAGLYGLIARILDLPLTGWSYTMLSIYFIGSIQLVFMGIIGEYVFRIYKESQGRPIYFVKKYYSGENSNPQL